MTFFIGDNYPILEKPFSYQMEEDVIKLCYNNEVIGIYTYYCNPDLIKEDIEKFYIEKKRA